MNPTANAPQCEFLSMEQKFRAFVGGFGSGKTWVGGMAMCSHFWEWPKINQGYFAPTYGLIRDIFYPTIEEVAFEMGLRTKVREGNKEVHFYNSGTYRGTTICRSLENPDTIIGFKIGHGLLDEFDMLDRRKAQKAWRKVIARMRYKIKGLKNGLDVTTTPEGFKYVHELFVKAVAENPKLKDRYGIVQASTYDNEANLPDDYIDSLYETYTKELIDAYLKGKFVNLTAGTVFRNYNRERCRSRERIRGRKGDGKNYADRAEVLYFGMDFNVTKMAATCYVQRPNGWHAVAELKDVFDTPEMIRIIKERWVDKTATGGGGHRIVIYPDASAKGRETVDASKSDLALLEQAQFEVRANTSNPAVKDRINATNKQFEIGRLWINDTLCPTVAACLEGQVYDDNGEPDKKSGFDHQNEATSYPIAYEHPIVHDRVVRVGVSGT